MIPTRDGADFTISRDGHETTDLTELNRNQSERTGVQHGHCFKCLQENEKCCVCSLAFLGVVGGGLMMYVGTQCSIDTDLSERGLDARCIVFGLAGLAVFGLGTVKIVRIFCEIFRQRNIPEYVGLTH